MCHYPRMEKYSTAQLLSLTPGHTKQAFIGYPLDTVKNFWIGRDGYTWGDGADLTNQAGMRELYPALYSYAEDEGQRSDGLLGAGQAFWNQNFTDDETWQKIMDHSAKGRRAKEELEKNLESDLTRNYMQRELLRGDYGFTKDEIAAGKLPEIRYADRHEIFNRARHLADQNRKGLGGLFGMSKNETLGEAWNDPAIGTRLVNTAGGLASDVVHGVNNIRRGLINKIRGKKQDSNIVVYPDGTVAVSTPGSRNKELVMDGFNAVTSGLAATPFGWGFGRTAKLMDAAVGKGLRATGSGLSRMTHGTANVITGMGASAPGQFIRNGIKGLPGIGPMAQAGRQGLRNVDSFIRGAGNATPAWLRPVGQNAWNSVVKPAVQYGGRPYAYDYAYKNYAQPYQQEYGNHQQEMQQVLGMGNQLHGMAQTDPNGWMASQPSNVQSPHYEYKPYINTQPKFKTAPEAPRTISTQNSTNSTPRVGGGFKLPSSGGLSGVEGASKNPLEPTAPPAPRPVVE